MKRLPLLLLACSLTAFAADGPTIIYSKLFPKSVPEYVLVTVQRDGRTTFQDQQVDDSPMTLQLDQSDADQLFALASKLDKFTRPLESGLKVAQTGMKTFRYEDGAVKNEIKFNYSLDENAKVLLDWFERIVESAELRESLDRAVHFEKLGVNQVLLYIETSMDNKKLVCREQFLPLLDRIAKNDTFLHMSRERAADLADAIRKSSKSNP